MAWQYLLRHWLGDSVRKRAYQTASQAVREQQARTQAAGDEPCDVGIVAALAIELGGVEDLLDSVLTITGDGFQVRRGRLAGRRVALVSSGVGRARAERATEALIAGHHPRWIISAGFAGSLSEQLARGDVVLADRLADEAGTRLAIDVHVDADEVAARPRLHVGTLLTVDRVVTGPGEKAALAQKHEALAVDMESMAVAAVCQRRRVPLLCVRVISDAHDEALPADIARLADQPTGAARAGAALGAMLNRPSSIKDMLSLKARAVEAADQLAMFLEGTVAQLEPHPARNETE